jgi:hypothetical protein
MKWVKPNRLYADMDVSASTILRLIKDGVLVEGKHYKIFPFGRRYNFQEIEMLSAHDSIADLIDDLLE